MHGCFFILARYFLRVDGVLLRIHDTRYYHAFGTGVVIRERTTREDTYERLKEKLPVAKYRDSDAVSEHLPVSSSVLENLHINEGVLGS
jgi:TIP41-like family